MSRRRLKSVIAVVFGLLLVLVPTIVLARAGGGGGFSSGGGGFSSGGGGFSSGGSGSGGGGDIYFLYLLIRLVFAYPLVGIPSVIIVVAFFVLTSRGGRSAYVAHTIRKGVSAMSQTQLDKGLEHLRSRDSSFDQSVFLERVGKAVPIVQAAWSEQDMRSARPLVSDGIYERFQLQLKMQKESYLRNVMQDVQVLQSIIVGVESDEFFDTLHVRVTVSAVDYTEDTRNGKLVEGNRSAESFSEIWSYLRRPGTKSLEKPGLIEGFCPNCGTPLELSDSTVCSSCRAIVNSGEYDWVLAEITQTEVWTQPADVKISGLHEMLKKDPAFNVQHVEDRASVIFWHLRAAEFFADPALLTKFSLPKYLSKNADKFSALEDGQHRFMADAAVGAVDVCGIETNAGEYDRIRVHIKWSGHREERKVPSLIKPDYSQSRFMSQDFMLVRKSDVVTGREHALTSAHCPGCGAPQTAGTRGVCEYCGLAQNDGSADWVLETVQSHLLFGTPSSAVDESETTSVPSIVLPGVMSKQDSELLIQCAIGVMLADGEIDAREKKALQTMAERRGISTQRLGALIKSVQSDGDVTPIDSGDNRANHDFLTALVRMCLADGKVTREEKRLIKALVEHMGYRDADIDLMISKERARLYSESKQVLKAARNSR